MAASFIKERLDRAVANTTWRCKFPLVRVINEDPRHSDHRPIIVDVGECELRRWEGPREVLKKFEARWLEEEDCMVKVEEVWGSAMMDEGESFGASGKGVETIMGVGQGCVGCVRKES